jgi:hypothetical protein
MSFKACLSGVCAASLFLSIVLMLVSYPATLLIKQKLQNGVRPLTVATERVEFAHAAMRHSIFALVPKSTCIDLNWLQMLHC